MKLNKPLLTCLCLCLCVLFFNTAAHAQLNISPATQEELITILKGLAEDHAYKQWCDNNCGQIHELNLSGKIQDGQLAVIIKGNIIGKRNGVLPLFGASPSVEIITLKNTTSEVPLVFFNKSYYTLLPPGAFELRGQIKVDKNASTNFTLPGAVGKILLDIDDQEPLLKNPKIGQVGNSFQIVSAARKTSSTGQTQDKQNLRLSITRDFNISRDKTFVYNINVIGAISGQVISLPLEHKEKVLETSPSHAKIFPDKVEFTATGSENYFSIQGEWTENKILLEAPEGAVQETWVINCQGAYDCTFSGEAEKSVTSTMHEWLPLTGQKLSVMWQELELLKGQAVVAQTALLNTKYTGNGIKQSLVLDMASSSATQMYLDLPETAIPTKLSYDNTPTSILKNDEGLIHLSIPQGNKLIQLDWELPKKISRHIPIPDIKLPVGKWVFWLSVNQTDSVWLTGGPAGSPVVKFWPTLVLCLFIGLLFLMAEKRIFQTRKTRLLFFLMYCAGYALSGPLPVLVLIALLVVIRWLPRIKNPRNIFGWFFEGGIVTTLILTTFISFFVLLNHAFFSTSPLHYDQFCTYWSPLQGISREAGTLCWEISLSQPGQALDAPYVLTLPTLAIRSFYFIWAILMGYFFFGELKNLWFGVKNYYNLGMKPLFKKKT